MAKYKDPTTGEVIEVGAPWLNPDLIKGKTEVPETTPLGYSTIGAESLAPASPIQYQSPQYSPSSAFPQVPEYVSTPKETEISDLIKELTKTTGLAGEKEAYRIEQEKAAGMDVLQQAEQDYTSQLKQLEADYKNIEHQMQISAEGRGITAGGLAPITASEQRKLLIRANTVSALLAAAQGKVTFAQSQIDKAVKDKFAVAEAERQAKLENLELLSKDPTLTVEQQKRADAQKTALENQKKQETKKKEDTQSIMQWALTAQQNGATPQQAQEIMNIALSDNPDLNKAFQLYSPWAAKPAKVEGGADITEFKAFFPNVDITTPQGQQQFLNWKAKMAGAGKPTEPTPEPDKIMTGEDLSRFKWTYGWTPPYGFTWGQLEQFQKDNPTATPEELEEGAKQVMAGETGQTIIKETPDDIISYINLNMTDEQLKKLKEKADEAGISSMWRGKKTDVKNYLNSIKDKIQQAIDGGYSQEEILEFLTQ